MIIDLTPIFFKFSFINNNLLLSLTVNSLKPLKIVNPFANDAAIDKIGISSICSGTSLDFKVVDFKKFNCSTLRSAINSLCVFF